MYDEDSCGCPPDKCKCDRNAIMRIGFMIVIALTAIAFAIKAYSVRKFAEDAKRQEMNTFIYNCIQQQNSPDRCEAIWKYKPDEA